MFRSNTESSGFVFGRRNAAACAAIVVGFAGYIVAQERGVTPYSVSRQSVDGGGAMYASGGSYELSGTIGQPDTGVIFGGEYQLAGGFWFRVLPGDVGEDGVIGLFDYDEFHRCLNGPDGGTLPEPCWVLDVDESGTVDLTDFATIQLSFSGQ